MTFIFVSTVDLPLYKTENVCLSDRLSVCSLFLMHDYSFEQICTKFGLWHPYTLQMVMEFSKRRLSQCARIGRRNGSSTTGAHEHRREIQK